jgi:predicted MFS family arabinose efflux permease
MSGSRSARVGYGAALASGEFRAVVTERFVSVAGLSIAAVALTVVIYERTNSPALSALTFALVFLPYPLGGGLLSSVVDRFRPRRLVASCDTAAALLAALISLPGLPVGALLGSLAGIGTLISLSSGARAALTRSTVPDDGYVPARSLMRIAAQLAQIGGNASGGALLVVLSPRGALLVTAASFAVSAAIVRLAVGDHGNAGQRGTAPILRDSLDGAREVFAKTELRRLLLVGWLAPMCAVAPEALAAPYVASKGGSPALVAWWLLALPVGTIAGDVCAVRLLDQDRRERLIVPALVGSFLPYVVFAFEPSLTAGLEAVSIHRREGTR